MIILGIDPGAKGAVAFFNTNFGYIEVSKIYNKNGTLRDSFLKLMRELPKETTKVFLELVNGIPSWGYKNFGFGKAFGGITHILAILELPYELVSARTWQKKVCDSGCKIKKAVKKLKRLSDKEKNKVKRLRYKAKKEANMILAKRLFPKFGYLLDVKGNDGLADALLIMEYGRREIGLEPHIVISEKGVDVAREDIFR